MPAPETVLVEMQALPRRGEARDAQELVVARERELCGAAGLERRQTAIVDAFCQQRSA